MAIHYLFRGLSSIVLLTLISRLSISPARAQNSAGIGNGSFEQGLSGWNAVGAVVVLGPPTQVATGTDGTHAVNIGAYNNVGAALYQTIPVQPGTNYTLSFDTGANGVGIAGLTSAVEVVVQSMGQTLAAETFSDVSPAPVAGGNGFTPRSLSFVVPAGVYAVTLDFLDASPNGGVGVDVMVDNVRLSTGGTIEPPLIVSQPHDQTVTAGGLATFGVAASGTQPLSYQWLFNSTNIESATNSYLKLPNVQLAQAGNYSVIVSNFVGTAVSSNAVLSVNPPDFIGVTNGSFEFGLSGWTVSGAVLVVGPPSNDPTGTDGIHVANIGAFNNVGASLSQTVGVQSGASYVLSFDTAANGVGVAGLTGAVQVGVQASGQTLASETVTDVSPGQLPSTNGFTSRNLGFAVPPGISTVTISFADQSPNGGAGVDPMIDNVHFLGVGQSPAIISQPQSVVTTAGGTASFGVVANGTNPLSYQWLFNGVAIAGATGASLTLQDAQPAATGNYSVTVSNFAGVIVSSNAVLTVSVLPFAGITNGSFEFGLSGWSAVGAVVVLGPSTQVPIGTDGSHAVNIGAYNNVGAALYQTIPVEPGTNYTLSFDTGANGVEVAGLTSAVQVVVQSMGKVLATQTFTDVSPAPLAGGNGFTPRSLSFVVPAGVYAVTLDFLDASPNGGVGVDVMVDNVRLSTGGTIEPPLIVSQPHDQTVTAGGLATFGVAASGTQPLSYQWLFNSTNIESATNSYLKLPNVQLAQAGNYSVIVSNFVGTAVSSNAVLSVNPPAFIGVTNGSFEFGLSGWTVSGAVLVVGPPSNDPTGTDGTHVANIGAFNNVGASLSQTVGVQSGGSYVLSFDTAANGINVAGLTGIVQVAVQAMGQTLASETVTDVSPGQVPGTNGFTSRNLGFAVPPGISTVTITFADQSPNGGAGVDPMIDNVRLTADTPQPPIIVNQPQSATVTAGGVATFDVASAGSSPLSYQWSYNGIPIGGGTDATFSITNVQLNNAGFYSVTITNSVGAVTSVNALLTVALPPVIVQVLSTNADPGTVVTIPIVLVANGNENAVGLSINFDPSILSYEGLVLGSGALGATAFVNTNQVAAGNLGLALALPTGTNFSSGTQQVFRVSFLTAALAGSISTSLSTGDQPTKRQVSDPQAQALKAVFVSGAVSISGAGVEGDVAPRPEGDGSVTVTDWVLLGRYVARLDYTTNSGEFQRADCAPRSTLGDGQITVADWVQAGRYTAGIDSPTIGGGPTTEIPKANVVKSTRKGSSQRAIRVGSADFIQSQPGTLPVFLDSQGNENGISFSLAFDPNAFSYVDATLGSDASSATLVPNVAEASSGRIAFVLALPPNSTFASGTRETLRIRLRPLVPVSTTYAVAIVDIPVVRQVVDAQATDLVSQYADATIAVNPIPSLTIRQSSSDILVSWPQWASAFDLQQADGLSQSPLNWTNISSGIITNGLSNLISLPNTSGTRFFRLHER